MKSGSIHNFAAEIWKEFKEWGVTDGKVWIFVFKSTLAVLLALWISLRFNFAQPSTAMITVVVVMQPQTGLVVAKSLYRILGTFAGAFVSMILVATFAQQSVLFLLGLAT
ncbi:MAG: FUSC family protein, partial [Desulfuromonadales bacterium]|nr:FUSC family protein [Desulfuromonadales bacterium]